MHPSFLTIALVPVLAITFSAISLPANAAESPQAASRPNVIFIIADDMRPEMFNFLPEGAGKNLTPTIDRLASEGVIMQQQYVASPVCTPSRYNCLTGRYASRATNGAFLRDTARSNQTVVGWNSFITPKDTTIAHLMKKEGYATGFAGKDHVFDVQGLEKLEWEADAKDPAVVKRLKLNAQQTEQAIKKCGFDYAKNVYHNNPDHLGVRELAVHNLDWITKAGVDFIDANQDQPFFLYFATTVPHGPNEPKRSWDANPLATAEGYLAKPLDVQPSRDSIPKRLQEAGLNPGNNKGNVLWLDDAVGAMVKRLEKHGIDDNTIIFFFNDHGQTAKGTLYQGGIHNPSVIWKKGGFPCGPTCDVAVSNVDFVPTILDLIGASLKQSSFDGQSFLPALTGKASSIHDSFYFEMGFTRAILQGNHKYLAVRYPEKIAKMTMVERQRRLDEFNANMKRRGRPLSTATASTPFSHIQAIPGGGDAERESTSKYPSYSDSDQLYDLSQDPDEQNNLVNDPKHLGKLNELKRILDQYVSDLPGQFGELGTTIPRSAKRLSPTTNER